MEPHLSTTSPSVITVRYAHHAGDGRATASSVMLVGAHLNARDASLEGELDKLPFPTARVLSGVRPRRVRKPLRCALKSAAQCSSFSRYTILSNSQVCKSAALVSNADTSRFACYLFDNDVPRFSRNPVETIGDPVVLRTKIRCTFEP
ncbi:unnamed protein product [Sphagnum balticum]